MTPQAKTQQVAAVLSKVPHVTLAFWIAKILATTLGETGGDALSMSLNLGYGVSSLIFLSYFAVTLAFQVSAKRYHPLFYWAVVVGTTTVGTTTSDYIDRTLEVGYVASSIMLSILVIVVLAIWHFTTGKIAVDRVITRTDETFYWIAILVSNTLGTALGDYVADDAGFGFAGGAILFAVLIAVVVGLHFFTKLPASVLFWSAYVLTRPLGATLGDTLTKSLEEGGLNLGRIGSSLVIAVALIAVVAFTWRRERTEPSV